VETIETLGKYEIKRPLGRGAMGIVYEGWDPIIARRVAIKTVRLPDHADPETEEALARFRREAQAAGRLTHPNIVAVFDYGETNDLAYIVMEFVDGPSLKMLLDREERFALADTVRVMDDLLVGLQFSHERGVVHRDIKPANVMLTNAGQAKIADFGIARIESSSMTQAGTLLGTPAYMSPEQFMGQTVDARTDIYSSGVLLYLLLTGERPFEGGMSSIMHKALNTEPSAPSLLSVTAPPSLDAVVRRAMAKRPEDRFPSARAFAEAIRAAVERKADPAAGEYEATVVAPRPPPPRVVPIAPPAKRSRTPFVAVAASVGLGMLGGGAWFLLSSPAPPIRTMAPQAPAPVAEVTPPPPPATPEPDALRDRIAQWANGRSCAVLGGDVGDGGSVALNGLAGNQLIEDLRWSLTSLVPANRTEWGVTGVDPVFCPALNVLHQITPGFGASGEPRLGLQMADGETRLADPAPIRVQLVMPDFAGWLRVDYVAHNGVVQHLYPQLAEPKNAITADQPRAFAPGTPVHLGHPSWQIGPPYGSDMIIAIASSDPLFDNARPTNAEAADVYLRDLQMAVDELRQRSARLMGAVVTLEALPPSAR
jgi:serine/threonine-protein kinase